MNQRSFLKAEWRKLAMANYAVDKALLNKYLPANTELDLWNGRCYVSLVGFMFLNTRLKGMSIPFHINFEEVNLRFYVRYKENSEWRRGVVFIKEIVPRSALTFVANTIYGENYETMPMKHQWINSGNKITVEYSWKKERWNSLKVIADRNPVEIADGSEEEFITEHFWGYTKVSELKTSEYGVEHPRWMVYPIIDCSIDVNFADVYGSEFEILGNQKPNSACLAEGSEIIVRHGRKIPEHLLV
jgi:uncharacterized protein YqjF (DUF2071 family)